METNTQTKKTAAKRVSAKTKVAASDPFANSVEEGAVKKGVTAKVVKEGKSKTRSVANVVEPAKVRRAPKTILADPFAELAEPTSPIRKRKLKTAKVEIAEPKKAAKRTAKKSSVDVVDAAATGSAVKLSPVFKALAEPVLPELDRENRARLQMQTPTRLYFYWSIKENPWALLKKMFGDDLGSYTLVLKLIDKKLGFEEIHQTDAAGNWWFDVEPDHTYQAEIGFYAPNRPYFRVLHSNTVETPRRSPSPRAATDADWSVSANKFAEVLDVAGFSRDAFDVALAGDDHAAALNASQSAISSLLGKGEYNLAGISDDEIRYAMIALASGATLEELRFRISPAALCDSTSKRREPRSRQCNGGPDRAF